MAADTWTAQQATAATTHLARLQQDATVGGNRQNKQSQHADTHAAHLDEFGGTQGGSKGFGLGLLH